MEMGLRCTEGLPERNRSFRTLRLATVAGTGKPFHCLMPTLASAIGLLPLKLAGQ
jgi:hypothetical protein